MQHTLARRLACGAAAAAALAAPLAHASLANGGFESGDFSGWTLSSADDFAFVTDLLPRSGGFHAAFGDGGAGSTLSQTFATSPGTRYVVSFWLQLDDGATPNSFSWSWDGALQGPPMSDLTAGFDYTELTAVLTATAATTTLAFNFVNPNSFWLLDDVSVAVIPEPGRAALMLAGLLLLSAAVRARRRG